MLEYGVKKYIQDVQDGTIRLKEETRKKSAVERYAEKVKSNSKFNDIQTDRNIILQNQQVRNDEEWKPTKRTKENQNY